MGSRAHSPPPRERAVVLTLSSLPNDVLLRICHFMDARSLRALCAACSAWRQLIHTRVWPRRVAACLGVRAIRFTRAAARTRGGVRSCADWMRMERTFNTFPSSRVLCVCVMLSEHDSVTSLALRYGVSVHDILRTNALFAEHQLASRTHAYVPLLSEAALTALTGVERRLHTPVVLTDVTLSNKYFVVVQFCGGSGSGWRQQQHTYVRQLVVKLMAKGLCVHEDELRYYLQDSHFDVAKAYKQLLRDHQFLGA